MNVTLTEPETITETAVWDPRTEELRVLANDVLGAPGYVYRRQVRSIYRAQDVVDAIVPDGETESFSRQSDGTWAARFKRPNAIYTSGLPYAQCHVCEAYRGNRHYAGCRYEHLDPPASTSELFVWWNVDGGDIVCQDHANATLRALAKEEPGETEIHLGTGRWIKQQLDHADGMYCEHRNCTTRP